MKPDGIASDGMDGPIGLRAPDAGTFEALSKKVPNLPRTVCHSSHFFLDVNKL